MNDGLTLATAGLLYMGLVMWAVRPPDTCVMVFDPHRSLDVERGVDREHLGRDAIELARATSRYAAHLPQTAGSAAGAVAACESKLVSELAAVHDLTLDEVRGAIATRR